MERGSLLVGVQVGAVELNETMTTPLAVRYAGDGDEAALPDTLNAAEDYIVVAVGAVVVV